MTKIIKNKSFISVLAIGIALIALFAGVYAIAKVNTNMDSSASISSDDAARCQKGCASVDTNSFVGCTRLCKAIIGGATIAQACDKYKVLPAGSQCVTMMTGVMANLPSAQCATNTNTTFTVSECQLVEAGEKTCPGVCNSKDRFKANCLAKCNLIVPNE